MAIHQITAVALERRLPRAGHHSDVIVDAWYICHVQHHPSHRPVGCDQAQHAAPPRSARVADGGEGDHLVKDAAFLKAAGHMTDQHVMTLDHAGPLEARVRLAHAA